MPCQRQSFEDLPRDDQPRGAGLQLQRDVHLQKDVHLQSDRRLLTFLAAAPLLTAALLLTPLLAGCQTSIAALTPESAVLTLPEGVTPDDLTFDEPTADGMAPEELMADGTGTSELPTPDAPVRDLPLAEGPAPILPPSAEPGPGPGPGSEPVRAPRQPVRAPIREAPREPWVPAAGVPPPPPPPSWDKSEDSVIRVLPDGTRVVEPMVPGSRRAKPQPVRPPADGPRFTDPPPESSGGDPWLPRASETAPTAAPPAGMSPLGPPPAAGPPADAPPADAPPADAPPADAPPADAPPADAPPADAPPAVEPPPAKSAKPAKSTEDLGLPPGGRSQGPFGDAPAQPKATQPKPAPVEPAPALPAPAGGEQDPWLPGGTPAGEPPAAKPPAEGKLTLEQRVLAHVTRLNDRPGAKDVVGYPPALVPGDDPGMALTPGGKPALIIFHDDGSRASDLQAAQLLPLIVRMRSQIIFVPVDRGADATRTRGGEELARRYLDQVPTLAVLDSDRKTRLYRPGAVAAADVERALRAALGVSAQPAPAQPAPTQPGPRQPEPRSVQPPSDPWLPGATGPQPTQPGPTQPAPVQPSPGLPDGPPAGPAGSDPWEEPVMRSGRDLPAGRQPSQPKPTDPDPWLPGGSDTPAGPPQPIKPPEPIKPPSGAGEPDPWLPGGSDVPKPTEPAQPTQPGVDPSAPPAGARNPFEDLPPTSTRPDTTRPDTTRPEPAQPRQPEARPPSADEPERDGPTFSAPGSVSAREHAARLRATPGDAGVVGYPDHVLRSAPADRVLATGLKPCVIVFYDDASKASDLQAAEFLPLLVNRSRDVEVVLIDVGTKARWNEAQKKVVRTYYNFYVPTTVVLAPNRAPIKSWYSRIKWQDLDRAITQALGR